MHSVYSTWEIPSNDTPDYIPIHKLSKEFNQKQSLWKEFSLLQSYKFTESSRTVVHHAGPVLEGLQYARDDIVTG